MHCNLENLLRERSQRCRYTPLSLMMAKSVSSRVVQGMHNQLGGRCSGKCIDPFSQKRRHINFRVYRQNAARGDGHSFRYDVGYSAHRSREDQVATGWALVMPLAVLSLPTGYSVVVIIRLLWRKYRVDIWGRFLRKYFHGSSSLDLRHHCNSHNLRALCAYISEHVAIGQFLRGILPSRRWCIDELSCVSLWFLHERPSIRVIWQHHYNAPNFERLQF